MNRIRIRAVATLSLVAIGTGLLLYNHAHAASVSVINSPEQFQSAQDLIGDIPRSEVEGQITGPSAGHVGARNENETPLGQFVKHQRLSYGNIEIYVIYNRLYSVVIPQLYGINNTPISLNDGMINQLLNERRHVYAGGVGGIWASGPETQKFNPFFRPQVDVENDDDDDVPEPASVTLLAIGAILLLKRKTRSIQRAS